MTVIIEITEVFVAEDGDKIASVLIEIEKENMTHHPPIYDRLKIGSTNIYIAVNLLKKRETI